MKNALYPDRWRDHRRFEELDALLLQEARVAEAGPVIPLPPVIESRRVRPRVTGETRELIVQLSVAGCGWRAVVEKTGTPASIVTSVLRRWRKEKAKTASAELSARLEVPPNIRS